MIHVGKFAKHGQLVRARPGAATQANADRQAGRAAGALFRVIQLVLLPVGTAGYLWALPKLLVSSRRAGVSATVLASLYTRYMQHRLGTRVDEPAARLMAVMPNVSRSGFWLVAVPTTVARRVTGFVPRMYRYPYEGEAPLRHQETARTSYYDAALRRHLPGIKQLVILGAGFDTRAYRLSGAGPVRCFEVDKPATQAFKVSMLERAGLSAQLARYVADDLRAEDWYPRLLAAGFDPARRTFFLWEAVTMYLDRASVEATLRRIAEAAPGSAVSFDYFAAQTLASRSPYMRFARAATAFVGEPLDFGIDNTPPVRQRAAEFLGQFGLAVEEHHNFGRETRRRRAPAGFVTAVVSRAAEPPTDTAR